MKKIILNFIVLLHFSSFAMGNTYGSNEENILTTVKSELVIANIIIPADFDFTNIPPGYDNTTWVISYNHNLGGASIKIPANVIFDFQGGKIYNGTITFNNSYLPTNSDFKESTLLGTIDFDILNIENVGITKRSADAKRNMSIIKTVFGAQTSKYATVILPEYEIHVNLSENKKVLTENKTIQGISKISKILIYGTGGTVMHANNVVLENFSFDNSYAPTTNDGWRLMDQCSNLTMRNIDFICKVRPFRLSALTSTGLLQM